MVVSAAAGRRAPSSPRSLAANIRHRRGEPHCYALVVRAVEGKPVPDDVRQAMGRIDLISQGARDWIEFDIADHFPQRGREGGSRRRARDAFALSLVEKSPVRATLAHAVAPGARRDSWLLRLLVKHPELERPEQGDQGPVYRMREETRYGVIVELPARDVIRCPFKDCDGAQGSSRTVPIVEHFTRRLAGLVEFWTCKQCGREAEEVLWSKRIPPVHLRETFPDLGSAADTFAHMTGTPLEKLLAKLEADGHGAALSLPSSPFA